MWDKKEDWLTWLHKEREEMEKDRKKRGISVSDWIGEEILRLKNNGIFVSKGPVSKGGG